MREFYHEVTKLGKDFFCLILNLMVLIQGFSLTDFQYVKPLLEPRGKALKILAKTLKNHLNISKTIVLNFLFLFFFPFMNIFCFNS